MAYSDDQPTKHPSRPTDRATRMRGAIAVGVCAAVLCSCGGHSAAAPSAPSAPAPANPPGTGIGFMMGTVSDTAFRPLAAATIEVLDGPQAGLTTTADAAGHFSLSGTFDETTRFRATKSGHVTSTRTLQPFCAPCNPNWWINFSLEVLTPPVTMAGEYTATFIADNVCTMLPSELRTRTYTATIPAATPPGPANAYYEVTFGSQVFYQDWNVGGFGVAGDYVGFWLETLVEQIAPNTFLAFGGLAAASIGTAARSTIVLPFAGSIEYCVTTAAVGRYEDCYQHRAAADAQCTSDHHQLVLTRR